MTLKHSFSTLSNEFVLFSRYNDLSNQLLSENLQDAELRRIGKEYSALGRLVTLDEEKCKCEASILELEQLAKDELVK